MGFASGQTDTLFERVYEENYEWRIQQRVLDGIYIPEDLEDAFGEIKRLSEPEALDKFRSGAEEEVARKLHFGLGRWIIVNWGFYDGSRFSHYLKELGLSHPDDMAQFVIRTFHRELNNLPLDEEPLIEELREQRAAEYRSSHHKDTITVDPKD
jgi:hypothetical protein